MTEIEIQSRSPEKKLFNSQSEIKLFNGTILKLPQTLDKIEEATTELLSEAYQENVPNFWEYEKGSHIYVPVDDGEIRVIHFKPENPLNTRPIVLVSGWAVPPSTFQDFYEIMHERYEMYYVETREKASSRIKRFAKFTVSKKAKDLGNVITYLGLKDRDFVLMGTCWGSAIILQGLMDKTIDAPTVLTLDPMYTLTYSKFLLKFIIPLLPPFVIGLLRPILRKQRVGGMQEKKQKERVDATINAAVFWKWKSAAIHNRKFLLYGNLDKIEQEVFVVNGTSDYIHDPVHYPNIAFEIPKGRFLRLQGSEDKREYITAVVAREFSKVSNGVFPETLKGFEVKIPR